MNKFTIRQKVLQALDLCAPGVAKADDIARSMPMLGVTHDQKKAMVIKACVGLELNKYIVNRRGGNTTLEPLWAIEATGMAQITQDAEKLDAYIWDDLAY